MTALTMTVPVPVITATMTTAMTRVRSCQNLDQNGDNTIIIKLQHKPMLIELYFSCSDSYSKLSMQMKCYFF